MKWLSTQLYNETKGGIMHSAAITIALCCSTYALFIVMYIYYKATYSYSVVAS